MNKHLPSKTLKLRRRSARPSGISPGLQMRTRGKESFTEKELTYSQVIRFLLWHAPLMLILRPVPVLATIHSVLVFLIGVHFVLRDETPNRSILVLAYITSSEIMWRGTEAVLVWEYGKYISLLLCILMVFKYRLISKGMVWPVFFILILMPGIFIAPWFDRDAVSYDLSGPITLAVVSFAFHGIELKKTDLQRLFLMILGPSVSMAVLIVFMLLTNDITFYNTDVNELITGHIGANQVTATLSLGATAAFFYIFLSREDHRMRNLMVVLFAVFMTTSVLTFSRAGLWNAVGAIAVSLFFLVRDRTLLLRLQGVVLVVGVIGYFVVYPVLIDVTKGAVLARFSDFDSTGRDKLIIEDLKTFEEHWVTGVGVGQTRYYRDNYLDQFKSNHTEYTRLLAEHGVLGILALLFLFGVAASRAFTQQDPIWKGISVGFTAWALFYMIHSATRMVSVAFTFGVAAARYLPDQEAEDA
ncbi:MAG: O-antigen ligase family protein [Anaerolineales bacterium]|nr:O-antigen ligase family protein [Anaerolineales bacterium]